jgi:hypothetical protein
MGRSTFAQRRICGESEIDEVSAVSHEVQSSSLIKHSGGASMNDRLAVYLHDHLAGARFAVQLLERMRDAHRNEPISTFAASVLLPIEEDRAVLQRIANTLGEGRSIVKDAAAWVAEKATRFKLRMATDADLGVFETLEVLALGIVGKMKLWQALSAIEPFDSRLKEFDLVNLIRRAENQHAEVEAQRIAAAQNVLQGRST